MNSPWLPFLYQYSISGIFFLISILFAIHKGALDIKYSYGRRTLIQLVGGFLAMMLLHSAMIIASGV